MRRFPRLLLVVLCAMAALHCDGRTPLAQVPEELYGTWMTDGERYKRRTLEVRYDQVILGVGGIEFDRLSIERVDAKTSGERQVYRLHYIADEGYPDHLELTIDSLPEPTLTVGNIPFSWHRTDTR